MPDDDQLIIRLMDQLADLYKKEDEEEEWEKEKSTVEELLKSVINDLGSQYKILKAKGVGSAGLVFEVSDTRMKVSRAMKIPRPIEKKVDYHSGVLEKEIRKLLALNHENLIKIHYISSEKKETPYFLMDYVKDGKNISKYIEENNSSINEIMYLFKQAADGIRYLHANGVVHCDIKPDNMLVVGGSDNPKVLITDLGYSKYIRASGHKEIEVRFTRFYGHPTLGKNIVKQSGRDNTNARLSKIPGSQLTVAFDLFALGITMIKTLTNKFPKGFYQKKREVRDRYIFEYLRIIACRLLDGETPDSDQIDENPWISVDKLISNIAPEIMSEIRFRSTEEVCNDFAKLTNEQSIDQIVPELNPYDPAMVRIPGESHVIFSKRLKSIIDHPSFLRLMHVSQMGALNLVYPGATHTRFEHSLGVYALISRYLNALYNHTRDPLFRSIMSVQDLIASLLSGLLHDIGHYPLAHDLEETSKMFKHTDLTKEIIDFKPDDDTGSLADIILDEWGIKPELVLNIIKPGDDSSYRCKILNSILDGPIDADKMDYLHRDSVHIGLPYGLGIDTERILGQICIMRSDDGKSATVGVTQNGRVAAESMAWARYSMFSAAYWHHTSRSIKSMISAATTEIIEEHEDTEKMFEKFKEQVIFSGSVSETKTPLFGAALSIRSGDQQLFSWLLGEAAKHDLAEATDLLQMILGRALYKRLLVISASQDWNLYSKLDPILSTKARRTERDAFRKSFQKEFIDFLEPKVKLGCSDEEKKDFKELIKSKFLVLMDSPRVMEQDESLQTGIEGSGGRAGQMAKSLERSLMWMQLAENFRNAASRIRFFVHPDMKAIIASCMPDEEDQRVEFQNIAEDVWTKCTKAEEVSYTKA